MNERANPAPPPCPKGIVPLSEIRGPGLCIVRAMQREDRYAGLKSPTPYPTKGG